MTRPHGEGISVEHVAFRADACERIGGGHVVRCLALGEAVRRRGGRVSFVCGSLTAGAKAAIEAAGHRLLRIAPLPAAASADWDRAPLPPPVQEEDWAATLAALATDRPSWIVVDHYRLDRQWEGPARTSRFRLAVLDDLANRPHDCDLLVDQTFGRSAADYDGLVGGAARRLTGSAYALLRPEFAAARPEALARRRSAGPVRRVLVSLGTTDPGGATAPAVEAALAAAPDAEVDVVLARGAPSRTRVEALAAASSRVRVHDEADMAALGSAADLAVGAAGGSAWERCCLGLPSVILVLAANQRLVAAGLDAIGAARAAASVEEAKAALAALVAEADARLAMTAAAAPVADGLGAERVVAEMAGGAAASGEGVRLRRATADDAERVWLWRNDPGTRAVSQQHAPVPWPDHSAWWARAIAAPERDLFIVEQAGRPVAMVRFDLTGAGAAEVSINLAPETRGRGLGKEVLAAGCEAVSAARGPIRLEAAVQAGNHASRRIFEALGFRRSAGLGEDGFDRYVRPAQEEATETGEDVVQR